MSQQEIEQLLSSASEKGFASFKGNWAYNQLQAALFFTFDLLNIQPEGKWDLVESGGGLTVLGADRKLVAYYEGEGASDPQATETVVALIVQDKGVWRIDLSRLWAKGPWLVTDLRRSK